MGDSRYGNAVDRHEGNNAAANVHKRAKRFKMRHRRVDNVARNQRHQKVFHAVLLGGAAGENGNGFPIFYFKINDFEAHSLSDARDDRNILDRLAHYIVDDLFSRHFSFHAAEIYGERHFGVTENGLRFEYFSGCRSLFQGGLRVKAFAVFRVSD